MNNKSIDIIEFNIDEILKADKWTQKEYNMYKMLIDIVVKYKDKSQQFLKFKDDIDIIIKNIKKQPWYNRLDCAYFIKMIEFMNIISYEVINKDIIDVNIIIKIGTFLVTFVYNKNSDSYIYQIYFETENESNKAYLIDTNSSEDIISVPELSKILNITKNYTEFAYDIIHFCYEIQSYYDSTEKMNNLKMSKKYPVTLEQFMLKLTKRK